MPEVGGPVTVGRGPLPGRSLRDVVVGVFVQEGSYRDVPVEGVCPSP